jgi:hypothetical protein
VGIGNLAAGNGVTPTPKLLGFVTLELAKVGENRFQDFLKNIFGRATPKTKKTQIAFSGTIRPTWSSRWASPHFKR